MKEALLKQILICIKKNLPFSTIANKKYSFGQIGEMILQAEQENYIKYENGNYQLTEKSKTIFDSLKPFEEKSSRKKHYLKTAISIDDIYIPKYNGGN